MAEACRFGNHNIESKTSNNQDENFCIIHVLCVFISLVTILADLTTGKRVSAVSYVNWSRLFSVMI